MQCTGHPGLRYPLIVFVPLELLFSWWSWHTVQSGNATLAETTYSKFFISALNVRYCRPSCKSFAEPGTCATQQHSIPRRRMGATGHVPRIAQQSLDEQPPGPHICHIHTAAAASLCEHTRCSCSNSAPIASIVVFSMSCTPSCGQHLVSICKLQQCFCSWSVLLAALDVSSRQQRPVCCFILEPHLTASMLRLGRRCKQAGMCDAQGQHPHDRAPTSSPDGPRGA